MWDSSKINNIESLCRLLSIADGEKPGVRHINRFAEASILASGLKKSNFVNFLKYLAAEDLLKKQKKQVKNQKKYVVIYSKTNDDGSRFLNCRICEKKDDESIVEMLSRYDLQDAAIFVLEGNNIKILKDWIKE